MEDFEALCRQAQITFIVPIVQRPRPPVIGAPIAAAAVVDVKDKAVPKAAKGAANKEREATTQQQHSSEMDSAESGSLKKKLFSAEKKYLFFFILFF